MNEPFIPLNATARPVPGSADFRVAIINPAESPKPFQALRQGAAGSGLHKTDCKPTVTLHRDGESVSTIRIQCACGQLIELGCVYSPAPART